GPPKGAVLIEVDAEGAVRAKHSVDVEIDAPPPTLTATLEGADLSITSSSGLTLEGTLDLETQTLTATWTHTDGTSGDLRGTSSWRPWLVALTGAPRSISGARVRAALDIYGYGRPSPR